MLIDCDTCTARPRACGDCLVTHLLSVGPAPGRGDEGHGARDPALAGAARTAAVGPAPGRHGAELTESEVAAVAVLSAGGLVPPLRLVPRHQAG